ncbi:hypothetical protein KM043_011554 [Ampulex compressa]|nr:hypothetical protein KM043_011554 [Ampulex compressa]
MKVLNVAEKNDAAKNIAGYLSRGTSKRREGYSVYNKVFEFNANLWNQNCQMIMTSVSGHLLSDEFVGAYRRWQGCHPLSLFDAPVVKQCSEENSIKIKRTLEREIRGCNALIIWTDCDREGENIGFEIIQVCKAVKSSIRVHRAIFSEITEASINRALQNLSEPNKAISDAVDVRSELDLRIGAAFTRFQTLRLQKVFPRTLADMLISYGSCQFPTLGFVVERYLAIEKFKSEPYWKLKVVDIRDNITTEFRWSRVRLFEEMPCQVFLDICLEQPDATVQKVTSKPKSKWRPTPLDTVELEKQGSRKLRLSAKVTMQIAEKLYSQGYISYPRTETNIFPPSLNLVPLVTQQVNNRLWGSFAQNLLENGLTPRQGKKSDQAHPPIHPTKYADNLQGDEAKVYEFVVRHFLACLSSNAQGQETIVEIDIAGEKFLANGLQIIAKNYLDVYVYEKWSDKEIYTYQQGQTFRPDNIDIIKEETSPPNLLTEADLIVLMDKHGIGTDATHAEHIDTIKSRQYVGLMDDKHLMPGKLGIGLVMGYDDMGFQMSKPNLRSDLEKDLKLICESQKKPEDVLQSQIQKYRDVFKVALERANLIDNALANFLDEQPLPTEQLEIANPVQDIVVFKCPKCGCDMNLKNKKQTPGKYISCMGYPACNNAIWFPPTIEDVEVLNDICSNCSGDMHKLKFKIRRNAIPLYGNVHISCIGGCDPDFNEVLNIKDTSVKRQAQGNDTGYNSMDSMTGATTMSNTSVSHRNARQPPSSQNTRNRRPASNAKKNMKKDTFLEPDNFGSVANNPGPSSNSTAGNYSAKDDKNETWGNIDSNAVIMCSCHENAIQLTVKKDGPNKGRLFYKCAKPQGTSCNFFLWAANETDTGDSGNQMRVANMNNNSFNHTDWGNAGASTSSNDIMCACNQAARLLTVHKDGPNKGRQFYACPKGMSSTCKFFQWADEDVQSHNQSIDRGGSTSHNGRGRGQRNQGASQRPRANTGKRKCGICGVAGHTRKTCPQNVMD